jgi:hypothetical protein
VLVGVLRFGASNQSPLSGEQETDVGFEEVLGLYNHVKWRENGHGTIGKWRIAASKSVRGFTELDNGTGIDNQGTQLD